MCGSYQWTVAVHNAGHCEPRHDVLQCPKFLGMSQVTFSVVDLNPWFHGDTVSRRRLCGEVNRICHETGFFYLTNHGVPLELCHQLQVQSQTFFELPEREKEKLAKAHSPQFRGWEKLGSELTNNEVDYREQIDIGIDQAAVPNPEPYYLSLIGPNQWPDAHQLPEFRRTVTRYMDALSSLSRTLLEILSASLGLEHDHINRVFGTTPSPYLKLIRYPKTVSGGRGVGTHKDSGFLTLLLQDDQAGLQAQSNSGQWVSVDPIPGTLVVNTGELLQMVTHNYFIATPHRVFNASPATRFSAAFFYSPDLTTRLDPLPIDQEFIDKARKSPRHSTEGLMATRSEMSLGVQGMDSHRHFDVFGDRYWQRWIRSYPDIARKFYPEHI